MGVGSVVDWVRHRTLADPRPWLVVGKGPTAAGLTEATAGKYHVLTLNHACQLVTPALAHFADLEAFHDCEERLAALGCACCLPWHPHVRNAAGRKTLDDYAHAVRRCQDKRLGLLVSYNASTANTLPRNRLLPNITLRYFSAVGAFNVLAAAGVKEVVTAGVDGGTEYAPQFDPGTRLANGQKTFDVQLPELRATCRRHGITWVKL